MQASSARSRSLAARLFQLPAWLACVALCSFIPSGDGYAARPLSPFATDWVHQDSDLKPDPAVTFGTLPNGMRYAIMQNHMPAGALSMRLRIAAGSLHETDAQLGVAHLLEHMAFRGSKQIPDGEVVHTLERIGLQFGADTNAFTSHTQTVYKFDLPRSDTQSIDTGLLLLREIAGELNLSEFALQTERGVVLSELRLRDTAGQRAGMVETAAMLPGQRAPLRFPIGKADVLTKVDAQELRRFYETWYRPERAVLIVTGDADPKELERRIVERFSNWRGSGALNADPDLGTVRKPAKQNVLYVEPDLPTQLAIDWTAPYDPAATRRREIDNAIRFIGQAILNQRYDQAALESGAPFSDVEAVFIDNMMKSARVASVNISSTDEQWSAALMAAQRILNTTLKWGVTQDEVDRMIAAIRTSLQTSVAGAATRRTPQLADGLLSSIENHRVYLNPQQTADLIDSALENLKASKVTAALRKGFDGNGPLLFMTSPLPIEGGEEKLAQTFKDATNRRNADAVGAQAKAIWPYTDFGKPGEVVTQQTIDGLDATSVRFANGTTLIVKPTQFAKGQVQVSLRVAGGRTQVPKEHAPSIALLSALESGGLEKIDYSTMIKALSGKSYSLDINLGDDAVVFGGQTTPGDLDTQLQVFSAYLTDAAIRGGALAQAKRGLLDQLPQIEAEPSSNLAVHVTSRLLRDDPRWDLASAEQLSKVSAEDLRSWVSPMLRQGALQLAIVGDISVERAIAATAATLGALPVRPITSLQVSGGFTFPDGRSEPLVTHHRGPQDKAAVAMAWPAPDQRADAQTAVNMQVLAQIFRLRMTDAIRSNAGAGYSPRVSYEGSWSLSGYGRLLTYSDITPQRVDVFFDAARRTAEDLRAQPVKQDEFDRAQQPLISNLERAMQTNNFYAAQLAAPDVDPQRLAFLREQTALLRKVTPESVQALAKRVLSPALAWQQVVLPQATTP